MSTVAFADVVHQTLYFSRSVPHESIILDLVDTRWFQRLRDIAQTGNTCLVYMFSEHSRFGHSVGVAYLSNYLMDNLSKTYGKEIEEYRIAVNAAALLHDIGHCAPGSHTAYKTWYPDGIDCHEEVSVKVACEDPEIRAVLERYDPSLPEKVAAILTESSSVPAWTWEIISGGGWNVDRGNWCIVDSVMAGVSYGRYNIPALIESIVITEDGHLALRENRLDAMLHFAIARHSMYRQVYHHRVLLSSEALNAAIAKRARELGDELDFCDEVSYEVLHSKSSLELSLDTIFAMRESWWRYHLVRWSQSKDTVLADLSGRLLNRKLFKTVRIHKDEDQDALYAQCLEAVRASGYDPEYYLTKVGTKDVHAGDASQSMKVLMDNGEVRPLAQCEPLWEALTQESKVNQKSWLAMPAEAKKALGRDR